MPIGGSQAAKKRHDLVQAEKGTFLRLSINKPLQIQHDFDELQPMIQQSQFHQFPGLTVSDMALLFIPEPLEEEHKVSTPSLLSHEYCQPSLCLPKKLSKRSSTDSPRPKRAKGVQVANPNQKFGHWAIEQNKRYHWFLQIHNHHFLNKHMRRMDKIFKSMALFVGSREAQQCRSHHQKMQKKYHNICTILLNLRQQHYDTTNEEVLIEDITRNNIEIVDQILTADFLTNRKQQEQNGTPAESSPNYPCPVELSYEPLLMGQEEEKKDEESQGLHLMPMNPDHNCLDIVEQLFADYAPHINFDMI